MIVLVPIDKDGEDGVPVPFDLPRIQVGRGPHNDLVLDQEDLAASYEHATIAVHESRAVVVCELTANPTYIDGADVSLAPEEERQLKPGDILSFGKGWSTFRVSRVGELVEPRRASRPKSRGQGDASRANPGPGRRTQSLPPPLATRHERPERGVSPITFQVFKGDRMVREQVFDQPLIRIGRMKSSHLLLDDESVSRTHAVVEVTDEGEVLLIDLDSSSGTAVDGTRIKKAIVKSGAQIEFGKARVIVSYGSRTANAAVTAPRPSAHGKTKRRRTLTPPTAPEEEKFAPSSTEVLSADEVEVLDGPRLVVRRGGEQQEELVLTKPCTTIGRLRQNDIRLDDASVSGKHAMVVAEDGVFVVIDQRSTNGTYLNGKKCVGESLRNGDVIQIGHFELVFQAPDPLLSVKPPGTQVLSPEAANALFVKLGGHRGSKR